MTREEAIDFGNIWLEMNEDCKDSSTYAFFHIAIEALKQQPCANAISKQAAVDAIQKIHPVDTEYDCTLYDKVDVMYTLRDLPPVIPVECGEWHYNGYCGDCVCSVCKHEFDCDIANMRGFNFAMPKYCPNCGAKMKESEE